MKLHQLRCVLEVHRRGNHISAAAEALHTSQPGISKQIKQLETELGFPVFARQRNRVVGPTEAGREVIEIARRILDDVGTLESLRDDWLAREEGSLTVATTHTYARYVLPRVVTRFIRRYPRVRLGLLQGNPAQICEAVEAGEADLGVATETRRAFPSLAMLPCLPIRRSLIAPTGHPILRVKRLELEDIARYPIIAHDHARSGRWKIMEAFRRRGIEPNVTFGAVDADVCKTYVELGLGVAILATVAVDPKHDRGLRARDASHLFESSTTYVSLRRRSFLRRYVTEFIGMLAPELTPETIAGELRGGARAAKTPSAPQGGR